MIHEKIDEMIRERLSGGRGLGVEDILLVQALAGSQGGQGLDLNTLLPALIVGGGGIGRSRADRVALIALITALQAQQQAAGTISGGTQPTSNNTLTLLLALGLLGDDRGFYLPRRVSKSEVIEEDVTEREGEEEKEETGRRHRRT
jgi:hypothetical protein